MGEKTPTGSGTKKKRLARLQSLAVLPDDFPVKGGDEVYRRFDKMDHLHVHNALEIGYCLSGSGVLVVESKVFGFHRACVSIINNREYHMRRSLKGTSTDWAYIHVDPSRLLRQDSLEPELSDISRLGGPAFSNIIDEETHPGIVETVKRLREELQGKKPGYRTAVRGLVAILMTHLHRLPDVSSAQEMAASVGPFKGRVAQAMQYMANNFSEPISIEKMATDVCHVSLTHLQRLFRDAIGGTPRAFLTQLRVRSAAELLQATDRTVLDIALETGYSSVSSLNRNFKTLMGMSPREWRKENRHQYRPPDDA